jgi:hypothetical protein
MEFFSKSFEHKSINAFILLIFFNILFCSIAFYLFCWFLYRKKIVNLTDNITLKISAIIASTFDRGLFCLILGAVHQLLLKKNNMQLVILGSIEALWIISKIIFIWESNYKWKFQAWIHIF